MHVLLIGNVSTVTHYTAIIKEESGSTFAQRMKEQALDAEVEIRIENVTGTKLTGEIKQVITDRESYESRTVILANGGSSRMLGIPGENLQGVRLNAPKDGPHYKGRNVYVVGGADGATMPAYTNTPHCASFTVCFSPVLLSVNSSSSALPEPYTAVRLEWGMILMLSHLTARSLNSGIQASSSSTHTIVTLSAILDR